MKLTADRAALADALAWVAQAIPKRPAAPALSGIRLTARDSEVELHSYDYERSHAARVAVDVHDAGECLVSGHFLREIVGALKGKEVELVLEGPRLEIRSGRSTYRVSTLIAEDFPALPKFPATCGRVARDDFAEVLATVEHAAGRDQMLPILTAANIVADGDVLSATTTDRFRIARRQTGWDGAEGFEANVPVGGLVAALKGMTGTVTVGHSGGLFGVADDRRKVTMRCIDDAFPKVGMFFAGQTEPAVQTEVDAADLAAAVKRATMASAEHQTIRLAVTADEITVTADSDTSDAAEYVACESDGERQIGFNGAFLADALLAAGTERVRLGFTGGSTHTKPVTVTPVDGERIDIVVMPRRVS